MNDGMKQYLIHYIHQWCMRLDIPMPEVRFRKMKWMGNCQFYPKRIITINTRCTDRHDLEDTCRHEIIHLVNGTHNRNFFEFAKRIGNYRNETYEHFRDRTAVHIVGTKNGVPFKRKRYV